jgi:hypothetical protein
VFLALTWWVSADVASVFVRDVLLQEAHAGAMLPAQTLLTLRERDKAREQSYYQLLNHANQGFSQLLMVGLRWAWPSVRCYLISVYSRNNV